MHVQTRRVRSMIHNHTDTPDGFPIDGIYFCANIINTYYHGNAKTASHLKNCLQGIRRTAMRGPKTEGQRYELQIGIGGSFSSDELGKTTSSTLPSLTTEECMKNGKIARDNGDKLFKAKKHLTARGEYVIASELLGQRTWRECYNDLDWKSIAKEHATLVLQLGIRVLQLDWELGQFVSVKAVTMRWMII